MLVNISLSILRILNSSTNSNTQICNSVKSVSQVKMGSQIDRRRPEPWRKPQSMLKDGGIEAHDIYCVEDL